MRSQTWKFGRFFGSSPDVRCIPKPCHRQTAVWTDSSFEVSGSKIRLCTRTLRDRVLEGIPRLSLRVLWALVMGSFDSGGSVPWALFFVEGI